MHYLRKHLKMMKISRLIIIGIFCYLPLSSFAWGLLGHRIVGQIAQSYLTPKARLAVLKILGSESIAMASNWADFVKSDSTYNYLSTWHYVNIQAGLPWEDVKSFLEKDTSANAYNRINFLVKELKTKKLSAENKQKYLRILIHLVGDIHQPLHVGRPEDRGGNNIKILWFNTPYNLHQVWDQVLINFQQLSFTEYANAVNHPTTPQLKLWQRETLAQYFFQSYSIAQNIYADITLPDQKIGYDYNFRYIHILDEQMLKGGVRLAGILNNIFGK